MAFTYSAGNIGNVPSDPQERERRIHQRHARERDGGSVGWEHDCKANAVTYQGERECAICGLPQA